MSAITENDLKRLEDLIIASRDENRQRFTAIETAIGTTQGEMSALKTEIGSVKEIMQKEIADLRVSVAKVEGSLQNQQQFLQKIPELAERVGEIKNWRQIASVTLTAFISSAVTWTIRGGNLKP